jgi:peptidyl-prolyl cis-trans isomerase B (cyclophilin B)
MNDPVGDMLTRIRNAQMRGRSTHTVFGHVTEGQDVVDSIEGGDEIQGIEIHDSTDSLFAKESEKIEKWNSILSD